MRYFFKKPLPAFGHWRSPHLTELAEQLKLTEHRRKPSIRASQVLTFWARSCRMLYNSWPVSLNLSVERFKVSSSCWTCKTRMYTIELAKCSQNRALEASWPGHIWSLAPSPAVVVAFAALPTHSAWLAWISCESYDLQAPSSYIIICLQQFKVSKTDCGGTALDLWTYQGNSWQIRQWKQVQCATSCWHP